MPDTDILKELDDLDKEILSLRHWPYCMNEIRWAILYGRIACKALLRIETGEDPRVTVLNALAEIRRWHGYDDGQVDLVDQATVYPPDQMDLFGVNDA